VSDINERYAEAIERTQREEAERLARTFYETSNRLLPMHRPNDLDGLSMSWEIEDEWKKELAIAAFREILAERRRVDNEWFSWQMAGDINDPPRSRWP
jgi:hypothetical protein